MTTTISSNLKSRWRRRSRVLMLSGILSLIPLAGCGAMFTMFFGTGAVPPPDSEFGLGPRRSANGLYQVTIEPVEPLRVRRLQEVKLHIRDTSNAPVGNATVAIDGGMPQHGHGLPTQPRVTGFVGDGAYLVDGVRFNMGGWWELKFAIAAEAGADTVTFNLRL